MNKRLMLALPAAGLTAAGMLARLWQQRTAFEPETGLLTPCMPATWCVLAVVAAAAAVFFLLGRSAAREREFASYLSAFSQPGKWAVIPYLVAGALLVAGGALNVMDYLSPETENGALALILGALLVLAGACAVLVGAVGARTDEGAGRFVFALVLPGYSACAWMIQSYQARSTHPNAMTYGFLLFGALCAAEFCAMTASFSYERPRPLAAYWTGGMALVLLGMSAVDLSIEDDGANLLICLGYGVYVLAQLLCLIWRWEVPAQLTPWTPPADAENDEETTETAADAGDAKAEEDEVNDHE